MDEEVTTFGNINVKNLKVCSRNWIYARNIESSGGNLKFDKPKTQEVVSRILKFTEDKEKGSFNHSRERNELSLGLGNNEHIGYTRGLGKRTTWKHVFKGQTHVQETWQRPGG
jgi:hypothetical protein